MWVDGADPAVSEERTKAQAAEEIAGKRILDTPRRHRDNGELLFLLRSINAHMPWFRRIHIVTNGQRPAYVDLSSDTVRLVSHDRIFPSGAPTPSFNTFAIDSCVHEIEGLSEIFVRFSDDFFVGASVSKAEFLGSDALGRCLVGENIFAAPSGITHYEVLQENAIRFWQALRYLPFYNPVHAPQLRHQRMMRQLVSRWPEWFDETRRNRFRGRSDANTLFLYPYFSLFHGRRHDLNEIANERDAPGMVRLNEQSKRRLSVPQVMVGSPIDWRARLNRIAAQPPRFFNVNDDMADRPNPKDVSFVGERLCRMFPRPSPWEVNPDMFPGYARVAAGATVR